MPSDKRGHVWRGNVKRHTNAASGSMIVVRQPKTPTFDEVVAGAKRAAERVKRWPNWMKALSPMTRHLMDGQDDTCVPK